MDKKKNNEEKEEQKQPAFVRIHDNFIDNLVSLDTFISNVSPVVEKKERAKKKALTKFTKQLEKVLELPTGKDKNKAGSEKETRITSEQIDQIRILMREMPQVLPISQQDVLFRSAFVMLVSFFDFPPPLNANQSVILPLLIVSDTTTDFCRIPCS